MQSGLSTQGKIRVWAHPSLDAAQRGDDGRLLYEGHNAQTHAHLAGIVALLRQQDGVAASRFRPFSVWFEMDPSGELVEPSADDTGPSPLCVVEHQYVLADEDRESVTVTTETGPQVALRLTSYVSGDDWGGRVLGAFGLYSKGDLGAPPDPDAWTPGADNVNLLARALLGNLTVPTGMTLRYEWDLILVHLAGPVL